MPLRGHDHRQVVYCLAYTNGCLLDLLFFQPRLSVAPHRIVGTNTVCTLGKVEQNHCSRQALLPIRVLCVLCFVESETRHSIRTTKTMYDMHASRNWADDGAG